MPLRDHFHPPLSVSRPWQGVHGAWAAAIATHLNTLLPKFYVALPLVELGGRVEIDVATARENGAAQHASSGGVATALWAPPRASIRVPVDFTHPDVFEVRVFSEEGGLRLRAAIELVSPANKDRPAHRRAFAAKCASYLSQGASVVVVDVVSDRLANLHTELMNVLQLGADAVWQAPTSLSAVAYRTAVADEQVQLEIWPEALTVGASLPSLPLWLEADLCLPLELESTYVATCESLRIEV
ncbi:MAG: DUF4058 family protein [Gemmataceae bacterium]|nr:DUF4058 family protein [Gemmataceae bacterium]